MKPKNTRTRITAFILTLLFLFTGMILVALSITDFENARSLMDQLSPDGVLESFTISFYTLVRVPALITGVTLFVLGGLGIIFVDQLSQWINRFFYWSKDFIKAAGADFLQFWKTLFSRKLSWWEWVLLAILIGFAFYGRWVWLERPMLHDESYTFIAFAQRPFQKVISDYHLPNNHILNSVLIHFIYKIFGNFSPAMVRLPSFIAGILIVPFVYLWVREQEGKAPAAASAALIAYWPLLKNQSTNGRGYMMMALFTVILFGLGEVVRRRKNRVAWGLLVLVTVLNFYTLPIALYPFAILGAWLFFAGIFGDISEEYGSFWRYLKYLVGYGAASGVLTFLLYTPIFLIGSGWNSFFHNPFVSSLSWYEFTQSLPVRLTETASDWMLGVPVGLVGLLVVGVFLNLALHWKRKRSGLPLLFCILVSLVIVFLVQRPNPWPRIWTYLAPILLVMGVAGWFDLIEVLKFNDSFKQKLRAGLAIWLVGVALVFGVGHIRDNLKYAHGEPGQEESVVIFLKDELNSKDIVITPIGFGPAFWYYFDYYKIPMDNIMNLERTEDWQRVFFLVDDRENDSYRDLLVGNPVVPGEDGDCPERAVNEFFVYGHYSVMMCERNDK